MTTLTLTPAYGRDYKSKAAVLEAWNKNQDFEIATPGHHKYINQVDAARAGLIVRIRYNRLRSVMTIDPVVAS